MIIAMDIEDTMQDLLAKSVNVCSNSVSANEVIENKTITLAILDINLGGTTSIDVAQKCLALNIPIIFVTGYKDLSSLNDLDMSNINVLNKPLNKDELINALVTVNIN
jgi:two-component SAPR family response regulator